MRQYRFIARVTTRLPGSSELTLDLTKLFEVRRAHWSKSGDFDRTAFGEIDVLEGPAVWEAGCTLEMGIFDVVGMDFVEPSDFSLNPLYNEELRSVFFFFDCRQRFLIDIDFRFKTLSCGRNGIQFCVREVSNLVSITAVFSALPALLNWGAQFLPASLSLQLNWSSTSFARP